MLVYPLCIGYKLILLLLFAACGEQLERPKLFESSVTYFGGNEKKVLACNLFILIFIVHKGSKDERVIHCEVQCMLKYSLIFLNKI